MSGDIDDFRGLLAKVGNGETLSIGEAERAFDIMTSGDATPAQMGAFLMGLKVRGETAQELADELATNYRAVIEFVRSAPDELLNKKMTARGYRDVPASDIMNRMVVLHGLAHIYSVYASVFMSA